MYNNNNKAQLLILGPLVIWASLSYGSSVKTHEYIILHHRQYRSAPSVDTTIQDDKPSIVQAQIEPISRFPPRLYSFDPRPNIDLETLIPNYKSDKETLEFEPTTTMKSSTVSSPPLPSQDTPKEDTSDSPTLSTSSPSTIDVQHLGNTEGGSSDDPLFSVRDAIMTGRAVQKVYSALDSVAGFMPVKLKYIDPQQVSIDTIDSESTSDSKDVGKPSSGNSAVIESVTREESSDRSTEVVSTEKEVSEVSDHDTELVSTEKEVSEGSDRDTELVSIEKEISEVSNHDTELVSAEKEMSELSLHDDDVSSHTENSVSKGTAINESRGIVGVSQFGSSGVSYIIHNDNQPAPTYVPMENLPPPSRPVAQWRPDIFMKICCSEPDPQQLTSEDQSPPALLKVKTGYAQVGTTSLSPLYEKEKESEESIVTLINDDGIDNHDSVPLDVEITHEQEIIEEEPVALSLFSRLVNETLEGEPLNITESNLANETASHPEVSSNHTPRYEEAGSTYQDVTNFLRDLASSEGFQNAFLGDLIKNFGDLDQNAMKLIYSLLIGFFSV